MRIRVFRAFASNNSGSYTIVGTFRSAEVAQEVASLVREACAAHDTWLAANVDNADGRSPLDELAEKFSLVDGDRGRSDDWPQYGDPPKVTAAGHHVVLHAPYTVTMPRMFGELFYKRGGRVSVELNHAHAPIAVEIAFYAPSMAWNDPERATRFAAVEQALSEILPTLTAPKRNDDEVSIEPVFYGEEWGGRGLAIVFADLIDGVESVTRVAKEKGVDVLLTLRELDARMKDPFAHLRDTG